MRLASDSDGTLVDWWGVTVPPPQTEQSDCSYVTEEEEVPAWERRHSPARPGTRPQFLMSKNKNG